MFIQEAVNDYLWMLSGVNSQVAFDIAVNHTPVCMVGGGVKYRFDQTLCLSQIELETPVNSKLKCALTQLIYLTQPHVGGVGQ